MKINDEIIKEGLVNLLQVGDKINVVLYYKSIYDPNYSNKEVYSVKIESMTKTTIRIRIPCKDYITIYKRVSINKNSIKYRDVYGLYIVLKVYEEDKKNRFM